ncbi:MAG: hypothetical protein AAF191_16250 [Verrucomicrobiota bacterium]
MAYSVESKKSGNTYYLHLREQERKDGNKTRLYFFAKEIKDGSVDELPEGYMVIENERTGLPFLKRKDKK